MGSGQRHGRILLAKSGPDAKVNIVADNGKTYALNFSLKGFAAAHDDMVRTGQRQGQDAGRRP